MSDQSTLFDLIEQQESVTVECRDIPGFPGYRVGNDGSVWTTGYHGFGNKRHGKWKRMKGSIIWNGYVNFGLRQEKRFRNRAGHRLVLEVFVGPCPKGMVCRHLDGTRTNNNLSNLVWGTYEENEADKITHGTSHLVARGERSGSAKLTDEDVRVIRAKNAAGQTYVALAREYGMANSSIGDIVRRSHWKHVE